MKKEKTMWKPEFVRLLCIGLLAGCAATVPNEGNVRLLEGKAVGKLIFVHAGEDPDHPWSQEKRDSAAFDNRYIHEKPRLLLKYGGQDMIMKVFSESKLVQQCDEGAFEKEVHPAGGGGGSWMPGPGGPASGGMVWVGGGWSGPSTDYRQKYAIECDLKNHKDSLDVRLYDGDGLVSRYLVITR